MSRTATSALARRIRDARPDDLPAIRDIYAHHVLHGVATFELDPPSLDEIQARHRALAEQGMPYLVAESGGEILGYCYAGPYRPRPAYRYTLEDSVYIRHDAAGRGIGRALLAELIARGEAGGWRQMVAVIGDSANAGSVALHAALGFEPTGTLRAVGYKHGRWVDTVIMQRTLGAGNSTAPQGDMHPAQRSAPR